MKNALLVLTVLLSGAAEAAVPPHGVPLHVRRGFYTETDIGAFFTLGGPEITVFAYRDSGNLPVYSVVFLGASVVLFLVHLPFLDKAERKRREFLTGGMAPPWYGPA